MRKLVLRPDAESYAATEGAEVIAVSLDGGAGRYRRDKVNAARMVQVQWTLNPSQYAYWRAFWHTATKRGALPFLCDLVGEDGTGPLEHECYFVPGSVALPSQQGLTYVQTAQLEVKPHPVDDAVNESIMALFEAQGGDFSLSDLLNVDSPRLGINPGTFFMPGAKGVWYHPADYRTLFQDTAGTVPVRQLGDPVCYIKDKSGNGHDLVSAMTDGFGNPIGGQWARDSFGRYYVDFISADGYQLGYSSVDTGIDWGHPATSSIYIAAQMYAELDNQFILMYDQANQSGAGQRIGWGHAGDNFIPSANVTGDTPTVNDHPVTTRDALNTWMVHEHPRLFRRLNCDLTLSQVGMGFHGTAGIAASMRLYEAFVLPSQSVADEAVLNDYVYRLLRTS